MGQYVIVGGRPLNPVNPYSERLN